MTGRERGPAEVLPLRLLPDPAESAEEAEADPRSSEAWIARLGRYRPERQAESRRWDQPVALPPASAGDGRGPRARPWLIGAVLLGLAGGALLSALFGPRLFDGETPVALPLPPLSDPAPRPAGPAPSRDAPAAREALPVQAETAQPAAELPPLLAEPLSRSAPPPAEPLSPVVRDAIRATAESPAPEGPAAPGESLDAAATPGGL